MRKLKLGFLGLLISFCFLFFQINIIRATQENNAFLDVNHIAGGFEKIQERVTLFFKFSDSDKTKYKEFLAKKRLGELKYVIDNNQIDSIEEVASRYETYIGSLANFAVDHKVSSEKENLLRMFPEHQKILVDFANKFDYESGWWLVLQHDININKTSQQRVSNL